MRTKAVCDLVQLSDQDFFSEISIGLEHILNNACHIDQDASILVSHKRPQGYLILLGMVEEEAAKFHILLDAVRCPRDSSNKRLTQHLKRVYNHLAKGIYAEACGWRPTKFGELMEYINLERQEYYLDGADTVEYIFRNWILQTREEMIYVDYVDTDEGHQWLTPSADDFFVQLSHTPSPALRLARAFLDSGCTTPKALELIAKFWRKVEMSQDFSWFDLRKLNIKTLEELDNQNLLHKQPQAVYDTIVEHWFFPMHSLDLNMIKVDKAELKKIQEDYSMLDW